jgi:hypothetical protein
MLGLNLVEHVMSMKKKGEIVECCGERGSEFHEEDEEQILKMVI